MVLINADQLNTPDFGGVTDIAACTELVSIDLLNLRTMAAAVETSVAACAGVWLMTTGSSCCISDWAMKIFSVMLGTLIKGLVLVVGLTTTVSLVLSRLTNTV